MAVTMSARSDREEIMMIPASWCLSSRRDFIHEIDARRVGQHPVDKAELEAHLAQDRSGLTPRLDESDDVPRPLQGSLNRISDGILDEQYFH